MHMNLPTMRWSHCCLRSKLHPSISFANATRSGGLPFRIFGEGGISLVRFCADVGRRHSRRHYAVLSTRKQFTPPSRKNHFVSFPSAYPKMRSRSYGYCGTNVRSLSTSMQSVLLNGDDGEQPCTDCYVAPRIQESRCEQAGLHGLFKEESRFEQRTSFLRSASALCVFSNGAHQRRCFTLDASSSKIDSGNRTSPEHATQEAMEDDAFPSFTNRSETEVAAELSAVPPADAVLQSSASMQKRLISSKKQPLRRILRDPDKELYQQIRTMQHRRKEESRLQTANNVYRALMGNVLICAAKFGAYLSSGSSGLMAEFVHSLVDCGNQALLLIGLRDSKLAADRAHPYGYGKSVYFWALVSALGTFFLGAGVSMTHAVANLAHPTLQEITTEVWGVLVFSFVVDGYILSKTLRESLQDKPAHISWWKHLSNIRDPATLAILLEDGAACLGVVMALGGIAASHSTGLPVYDAFAGVGISALLGIMGLTLVRVNHRFLLGQGVDKEMTDEIERILLSRRSIDSIGSVQSQWTGPETFSYKAEVDFDGTYLAAKLMPIYQHEFLKIRHSMDEELQVLLALYAEDVMRTVEREVRHVEAQIRKRYPGAEYIELEPMSIHADRLAIDDNLVAELRRVESDALNRFLKTLKGEESAASTTAATANPTSGQLPPSSTSANTVGSTPTGSSSSSSS